MAVDLNNLLANALLDRYDTEFPAGSTVDFRTGAVAGAENADSGTLLGTLTLPATPWAAAATGAKLKQGAWTFTGIAAGVAGHYRMKNAADTRREEGTCGLGTGDMQLDNTNIAIGQVVTVNTFTKTL